ncbi:MAG: VWA domain-containing protein [Myxococcota bacterium]
MQRWQLTTGLAVGAFLAAVVAPSIYQLYPIEPAISPAVLPTPEPVLEPAPVVEAGTLSLSVALDQDAQLLNSGEDRFIVIEVNAQDAEPAARTPVHLAVVMDTSGSMGGRGKITHARMAAAELAAQLGPDDTLSLVTFDDRADVLIRSGSADQASRMQRLIQGIKPGGGTNIYDGLTQGQALLSDPALSGVKRVVLLSDGMANLGVVEPHELARISGSMVSQGVTVSGLGLGLDYNEDLLAAMSDAGGGNYHFIDKPGQLAQMFQQELSQMSAIVAREAVVDVTLPAGVTLLDVYGYDAEIDKDGYRVFLGDLHGGASRKIVARVRIDDSTVKKAPVAGVELGYVDLEAGEGRTTQASLVAEITPDAQAAARSINSRVGVEAATAAAARLLDEGARAWERGESERGAARLEAGAVMLKQMSARYAAPELETIAAEFDAQRDDFSSASPSDGVYQVKKAKERARVYSR